MIEIPQGLDPRQVLEDLDRVDAEQSLYQFIKRAWKYMDSAAWKDGWHIGAIAEHLEAVVDGQIKRLIINLPPRCGKSLITSVAFPAWTWAQTVRSHTSGPGVKFLYASYGDNLSIRDSGKCRSLIESNWYQQYWGSRFKLTGDNNTKRRFSNTEGGERLITSIRAGVTGEGGDCIVIDDPNSANDVESDATIENTLEWWRFTMPTRPNDPALSAFVIIQQRLSKRDLTGWILENESEEEWTHLCLPGKFEKNRAFVTSIGWSDPRTEEGELLWPARFGEKEIRRLELKLGPWGFAGQIQQRPSPQRGGIIREEWWNLWDNPIFPAMDFILATLDTAYTSKEENDASAIIVWGVFQSQNAAQATRIINRETGRPEYLERTVSAGTPRVMCMHAWTARLEIHELVKKVAATCRAMKVDVLKIENKAAGHSVEQELRRLYANEPFSVQFFDPKSQDKKARLHSVVNFFASGMVYAPETTWAREVIDQCEIFDRGDHDDLVDCVSMGLRTLRELGLLEMQAEVELHEESLKAYPGRQQALYNC